MQPPSPSATGTRLTAVFLALLGVMALCLSPALAAPPAANADPDAAAIRQANDLSGDIKQMASALFSHLADPDPQGGDLAQGMAVCSFVDLKKLTRTSSFGRYLAEQLMNEFQQRGYRVVEMRKTTSLMLQEKRGEYGLSRNPEELPQELQAPVMLTGTYTPAGDSILVSAKLIDNRNSVMLSSATLIFPRTPLVAKLLADSVSASTGEDEVVYMKRLEL